MGKLKIYPFCCIFCIFFWSLGFCEIITLKSGKKIEGKITEQTDKYVKLDLQGAEVVYLNEEIAAINQTDLSSEPQKEPFYKEYIVSLDAPKNPSEGRYKNIGASTYGASKRYTQTAPVNKTIPANMLTPDFQLSTYYQDMVKSALANLQVSNLKEEQSQESIQPVAKSTTSPASQATLASTSASNSSKPPIGYQEKEKPDVDNLEVFKSKERIGY